MEKFSLSQTLLAGTIGGLLATQVADCMDGQIPIPTTAEDCRDVLAKIPSKDEEALAKVHNPIILKCRVLVDALTPTTPPEPHSPTNE